MGRPAPTITVRLERLKRRIEAIDLTEDEVKQLEREERALSAQTNYRKRIAKQKLPLDKKDETSFMECLSSQNFQCAICTGEVKWQDKSSHWDHCHATGKWRGILCVNCNIGLGNFRDNINNLNAAIKYLNHWEQEHSKMNRSAILKMADEEAKMHEQKYHQLPNEFVVETLDN